MLEVGQKVVFDPYKGVKGFDKEYYSRDVVGKICYVNYPHRWFGVEWGNPKQKTSFKFSQIGEDVKLHGR